MPAGQRIALDLADAERARTIADDDRSRQAKNSGSFAPGATRATAKGRGTARKQPPRP
jgi:hypothetical protein